MPPFLRPSLPALTFPRFALTEQGAKTIAYNQRQHAKPKEKTQQRKSKNESKRNKQTRQKAKEKGKPIILYSTHIQKQEKRKANNNSQARQREKQKRSPEKHINRQAREKRKAILFPSMPIYRIAIYYNKAI